MSETVGNSVVVARRRSRRIAESVGFVAVWMALGFVLRAGANTYLLIGVPLTVSFQLFVRRERLEDLWVRGGRPIARAWGLRFLVVAAVVAGVVFAQTRAAADLALWFGAAVIGAGGVVYASSHASRRTLRDLAMCAAASGTIGIVILVVAAVARRNAHFRPGTGLVSLVLYLAVVFVLEEVTFRGAIDSHVHHDGEPYRWLSAAGVAAMWGLWHLPITHGAIGPRIASLLVVHVPVGIGLSLFWRRSGNLLVPGFTHALIDAVRNALA